MKGISNIIFTLTVALASALASCHSPRIEGEYTVRAWYEIRPGERLVMETGRVWGADLDYGEWCVASYADATANPPVATLRADMELEESARRKENFSMEFLSGDGINFGYTITRQPAMLLMYDTDPARPMFAFGDSNITKDLAAVTVSLSFQPWNTPEIPHEFAQGSHWTMVNEDTMVPVKCRYNVQARERESEESTTTTIIPGIIAYALSGVDTARWEVLSIEDARAGTLTHRETGEKRSFGADAEDQTKILGAEEERIEFVIGSDPDAEEDPLYPLGRIVSRKIMIVLADPSRRLFAFGGADLLRNPTRPTGDLVTFRPYVAVTENDTSGRWTIVNDETAP